MLGKGSIQNDELFTVGTHLIEEESLGLLGGELEGDAGVPARGESYKVHQFKHEQFCGSRGPGSSAFLTPWIRDPDPGSGMEKKPDPRFGIRDKHHGSCF